jgi:iron complex transport system substrate-binding protein
MIRPIAAVLSSLLILSIGACSAPVVQQPPTITQPPAASPMSATRIVALTSLSADIVHRLDRQKLVGVSGGRLLRKNPNLAALPQVSEGQTPPNLEKILALKPDLVIGASGFHDKVIEKLKALGIRTITTEVSSWEALQTITQTLATELNVNPSPLIESYKSFLPTAPKNSKSTLVLVSEKPILAPNKVSWAGSLLTQFKINNMAADLQGQSIQKGSVTLSAEKVLESNPEILVIVDAGDGTIDKLKAAPFWSKLKAVINNRVYVFDYYGLVNPGSIDSIEQACKKLQQITASNPN